MFDRQAFEGGFAAAGRACRPEGWTLRGQLLWIVQGRRLIVLPGR